MIDLCNAANFANKCLYVRDLNIITHLGYFN